MDITSPNELTLTDLSAPASAGCSCGGCGCGEGASASTEEPVAESAAFREDFLVTGMTCGHCVASVTEELSGLAGVASVDVALEAGGTSVVTVESSAALDTDAVRAAVEEAGYALVNSPR
ncbi:hypothetical protein GCM10022239_02370 [Leifsonia bigeumensis]|uniref:HMA domain-containing protein n=1 Tax=Leifsonella bigeumensis TaxID=433643 RepID=A0ABP7F0T8_9MICO